jgi:hypothetical protein
MGGGEGFAAKRKYNEVQERWRNFLIDRKFPMSMKFSHVKMSDRFYLCRAMEVLHLVIDDALWLADLSSKNGADG